MAKPLYACLIVFILSGASWQTLASALTGGQIHHTVVRGDQLNIISARYGVATEVLARDNAIANPDRILIGQTLIIDNRHIVPTALDEGIVINIPQRMLFLFKDSALQFSFPVGLGRPSWPTPAGSFQIRALRKNPIWLVPKSIQEEMARENKQVREHVPPGPDNPLGMYWIGLSALGYGIHGTIARGSIYRFRSHGCIRLHPDDVARLFPVVRKGLRVDLIYQPLLLATAEGRVFVEIHPDVYNRSPVSLDDVRQLAATQQLTERIDWRRVEMLIQLKEGVARDVTLNDADTSDSSNTNTGIHR